MFKLSAKGRYSVRLMLDLALNYGKGPIALKDIAQRQKISEKYLEHLINPLKKAKLIRANRGAHGGYALLKPPSEISLKEIIAAVEGPLCVEDSGQNLSTDFLSRGAWSDLSEKINETLSGATLEKIIDKNIHNSEEFSYAI